MVPPEWCLLFPWEIYKINYTHLVLRRFIQLFRGFIDVSKLLVKMKYALGATWLILKYIMDAASVPNLE